MVTADPTPSVPGSEEIENFTSERLHRAEVLLQDYLDKKIPMWTDWELRVKEFMDDASQ